MRIPAIINMKYGTKLLALIFFGLLILSVHCMMTEFINPDSKVHGAKMGPISGRQDPDGPHVGLMNFAIWEQSVPL